MNHASGSSGVKRTGTESPLARVEVRDRPLFVADDARAILAIIEGTERWVRTVAAIDHPAERQRMVEIIAQSAESLRDRIGRAPLEGS